MPAKRRRRRSVGYGGAGLSSTSRPIESAQSRASWRFTCEVTGYARYVSSSTWTCNVNGSAWIDASQNFDCDINGTGFIDCSYTSWDVITGEENELWLPTLESDLILWLSPADAATVTEVAGRVSQLDDKSTSGWNHVQATAADQPLYSTSQLGTDPGIYFNGSLTENERLTNAAVSVTTDTLTWGIVAKLDATQTHPAARIACFKTSERAQEWDHITSIITLRYEAGPPARVIMERNGSYLTFGTFDTLAHIYVGVMDGTTIKAYLDGVYVGQINFTGALSAEHSAYGGSYLVNANAAVTLGDYQVYTGAASDTKRQVIEGHLHSTAPTDTTLVAGHPFETDAPTSGGGGVSPPPPPPPITTDVVVRAKQDAVAGANAQFRFVLNGVDISTVHEITATTDFEDVSFGIDTEVASITKFGVRFINDSYSAGPPIADRNLYVDRVSLGGTAFLATAGVQYDATTGQTITGANAGSMYNNGLLEWTTTTSPPPPPPPGPPPPPSPPPPPPSTGTVLTRSTNILTWGGETTKLWGGCNIPMGIFTFDGPATWTQAKQDRAYDQIKIIKDTFGFNYIRLCLAPGMYRYWNDPTRNRLFPFLDGYFDRCLAEGMFVELNWWTVSCPDGPRADDSFFPAEYAPGYDSSFTLCKEFWAAAAARYKDRGYVVFSIWDEPIKRVASDTWAQWRPYAQELVALIRGTGATNLISIPGNHYSMMFQEVLTTHPIVDATENWAFRFHAFEGAGEPQNYTAFTTSGGTLLDSVRPFIVGGAGHEPVTKLEPSPGVYKDWLTTHVYTKADALAWWCIDAWATPNLYQTGFPTDAATTLTNYGLYARDNPITPRVRPSGAVSPPPPPSPPPPSTGDPGLPTIPVFASPTDLTSSANIYVDTVAGNDASNGTTPALAKKTFAAGWGALGNNQKIALKAGSVVNGFTNISGKTGVTIGMYGSGSRPVFKNVRTFTGSQIQNRGGGKYTVSLGALPLSTAYAAARVDFALNVVVNGNHVCTWYARNGEGEVLGTSRTDMYWHTNGNCTFCSPITPTTVEIGYEDCFLISGHTNSTVQDCQFGPSRGHGIIMSGAEGYTLQRCEIFACGLSGLYLQSRSNALTSGVIIQGNRVRYCHSEGMTLAWPGNVRNAFRTTKVRDNIIQQCNKGPPVIQAGSRSQDYYSAAIKFFTEIWESPAWDNDIEVSGNLIEDIGDNDTAFLWGTGGFYYNGAAGYASNQGQGVWIDTVTGGSAGTVKVHHNTMRRLWAAGVFIEFSQAPHSVYNNVIEQYGLRLTGWSGGVCIGRGASGSIIYHNTFLNGGYGALVMQAAAGTNPTGDGRTLTQNCSNVVWRDNLVVQQSGRAHVHEIYLSGGTNGTVYNNNLFYGSNAYNYRSNPDPWSNPTTYTSLAAWTSARGGSVSNSRTGDPLLDAQYRPRSGSDAIGRASDGKNIGAAETVVP